MRFDASRARAARVFGKALVWVLPLWLCGFSSSARATARIAPAILRAMAAAGVPGIPAAPRPALVSGAMVVAPQVKAFPDGRIPCWVATNTSARPDTWPSRLAGCDLDGHFGSAVEIRIPAGEIGALADLPGVMNIGVPPHPYALDVPTPVALNEALPGMGAPAFWSSLGTGAGVRLGIIDLGFADYEQNLGVELPNHVTVKSFTGDITGGGEVHGTACAEVAHSVAPDADLYLANIGSISDLQNATQWMIDQGVEVISHSVGWFYGAGDGTGPIEDIVAQARQAGVVWVNAAGNFGLSHWGGTWVGTEGNAYASIPPYTDGIHLPTLAAGYELTLVLLWDSWQAPNYSQDLDFEIELYDGNGTLIGTSDTEMGGDPYAFRELDVVAQSQLAGLTVKIFRKYGDPTNHVLQFFRADQGELDPQDQMKNRSLAAPADSPLALAVGAYDWRDSTGVEDYSSRGPNTAGLVKPDLIGPDMIINSIYSPFGGTSAACPQVAGSVALLLSAGVHGGFFDARWGAADLLRMLKQEARPLVGSVPDSVQGWGRVHLPASRAAAIAGSQLRPQLEAQFSPPSGDLVIRFVHPPLSAGDLAVYDVTGRLLGRVAFSRVTSDLLEYQSAGLAAVLHAKGRYFAREPASGARLAFYWPGRSR